MAKMRGMSTPLGQGTQYWQLVHGMGDSFRYASRTWSNRARSFAVSVPGPERSALVTFSTTCGMALIPLSTTDTAGWFQTHCNAHSAGVRWRCAVAHRSITGWGGLLVNWPPRSGSITTTTASPFPAA